MVIKCIINNKKLMDHSNSMSILPPGALSLLKSLIFKGFSTTFVCTYYVSSMSSGMAQSNIESSSSSRNLFGARVNFCALGE